MKFNWRTIVGSNLTFDVDRQQFHEDSPIHDSLKLISRSSYPSWRLQSYPCPNRSSRFFSRPNQRRFLPVTWCRCWWKSVCRCRHIWRWKLPSPKCHSSRRVLQRNPCLFRWPWKVWKFYFLLNNIEKNHFTCWQLRLEFHVYFHSAESSQRRRLVTRSKSRFPASVAPCKPSRFRWSLKTN